MKNFNEQLDDRLKYLVEKPKILWMHNSHSKKTTKISYKMFGSSSQPMNARNNNISIIRASTYHLLCTKKTTFFYFIHLFLQNTHISPSIIHYILYK